MAQIVETRSVGALKPHPKNAELYGDGADEKFIDSVRRIGVQTPLRVAYDDRIISGHRRWDAAKRAGLAEVPVIVSPARDELDILEELIELNRRDRVRTNEQMTREFIALGDIFHQRESRQGQGGGQPAQKRAKATSDTAVSEVGTPKPLKPSVRAAREVGVGQPSLDKGVAVVAVVDKLTEEGKTEEADRLRKALNKGFKTGYQAAKKNGHIAPPPPALNDPGLDKTVITLPVWQELGAEQRAQVLARPRSNHTFNPQPSTDIEWARHSWNPVTGCKHDCSYCYARDIAIGKPNRPGYAWGFVLAFLPERLGAPSKTHVPQIAAQDVAHRNVFTCSMADLFGRWVPAEWIEAVLDQARGNPQWNFLFLTKFPIRLQEFDFPDNAWVGTTVDAQARVKNAERAFEKVNARVKWLSCEPLLEPLHFERLGLFQWIVMGGASASTQTPAWRPRRAWVDDLRGQARRAGCRVYEKTNLLERLREYPGQPEPERISIPDAFKMPYLQRDVLEPETYAAEVAP